MALRIRSLVYWNDSLSLSLSVAPFSPFFSLLETHTIVVVVVRFPALSSPSLVQFFVVLRLNPPDRTNSPLGRPLRFHLPSLSPPSFLYLSISAPLPLRCPPRRPSVAYTKPTGFYYEIRDSPGLVQVYPYLSTSFPPACSLRTRRRDIYWQTLRMLDHAGLRISDNIGLSYGLAEQGFISRKREIYIPITFHVFINERLTEKFLLYPL